MKKETAVTHTKKRFDELIKFLRNKPGVRAIFVHGSIARGTIDEWSDIDVLVVTLRRISFVRYVDGRLDMEVDAVCLDHIEERLRREPSLCHAWSQLQPVYDPEHLGLKINSLVKSFVRTYRTPKFLLADTYIRLRHLRQKCARGQNDKVVQAALVYSTVLELITAEFGLRNRIPPPAMIAVPMYLTQSFPTVAMKKLVRTSMTGKKNSQNLVSTIDLVNAKLAPVMRNFSQYYRAWNKR
jgi:predicted nucleotidyltransferase